MKEVSIIAVQPSDDENKLLMGVRTESGKWTLPGGHLEDHETPKQAAVRELKEETNI